MTSKLFDPLKIGPVTVPNRIAIAPMCQYSAKDGRADRDWHGQHLMNLAMSGAGLVMLEATAVQEFGRITPFCLGLWNDAQAAALGAVLAPARKLASELGNDARFGIQLGHAGRKGPAQRPWEGGGPITVAGWETVSASPIPYADDWAHPTELTKPSIADMKNAFVQAAVRAVALGIEVIEIHAAHGYLLHQFASALSNRRDDEYGGDMKRRRRLILEVVEAIHIALGGEDRKAAIGVRITGTDWVEGGITIEEAVALASAIAEPVDRLAPLPPGDVRPKKVPKADYVCVTSGGLVPNVSIPVAEGYQVPFAEQIKREAGITTRAVGMIVDPTHADLVIASGRADQVAIARAYLDNPRWVWHAAQKLGVADRIRYPKQYDRIRSDKWPGAALARPK